MHQTRSKSQLKHSIWSKKEIWIQNTDSDANSTQKIDPQIIKTDEAIWVFKQQSNTQLAKQMNNYYLSNYYINQTVLLSINNKHYSDLNYKKQTDEQNWNEMVLTTSNTPSAQTEGVSLS